MKKSLNLRNNKKVLRQDQEGSVLIILLIFVGFSILFAIGSLSITEWNSAVMDLRNHTQQSANAAAFTYGKTFVSEVKACIAEEIELQLETEGAPEFEQCRIDGLAECASSNFQVCELELESCWTDLDQSPLATCPKKPEVKEKAQAEASRAMEEVLGYRPYQKTALEFGEEQITVHTTHTKESVLPQLGQSGQIDAKANSKILIQPK